MNIVICIIYLPLSDLYLARSSNPSLNTEIITTNAKGKVEDRALKGLIEGKKLKIEISKK